MSTLDVMIEHREDRYPAEGHSSRVAELRIQHSSAIDEPLYNEAQAMADRQNVNALHNSVYGPTLNRVRDLRQLVHCLRLPSAQLMRELLNKISEIEATMTSVLSGPQEATPDPNADHDGDRAYYTPDYVANLATGDVNPHPEWADPRVRYTPHFYAGTPLTTRTFVTMAEEALAEEEPEDSGELNLSDGTF